MVVCDTSPTTSSVPQSSLVGKQNAGSSAAGDASFADYLMLGRALGSSPKDVEESLRRRNLAYEKDSEAEEYLAR